MTTFEWMPSQMYSLPEQLFRYAGLLINLAPRQCVVKLGNGAPFLTRTTDVRPAFKSLFAKRTIVPIFLATLRARSPYLRPALTVDALIAARALEPPSSPDPDFTAPEPVPLADPVHDAPGYARDFWARKKNAPKKPPGRRPHGELTPEHDRFRVVDGDGGDDGDNER